MLAKEKGIKDADFDLLDFIKVGDDRYEMSRRTYKRN